MINCLGLVRHLTQDVERFWFPGVIAGEPGVAGQLTTGAEAHWQAPENMSADEIFNDYRAAIERANAVVATAAERPAAPATLGTSTRRELIDGTTWLGGNPYAG